MGKQINFLMDDETENEFVKCIMDDGGKILFEGANTKPIEINVLPDKFSEKGWFQLYLYKKEFGELYLEKLDNGEEYIDTFSSPVIEYSRTIVRENKKEISRGRLWVQMKYWDSNSSLITKPGELDEWYKKLNKWIKRNVIKVTNLINNRKYIEYMTPGMKELVDKGYRVL